MNTENIKNKEVLEEDVIEFAMEDDNDVIEFGIEEDDDVEYQFEDDNYELELDEKDIDEQTKIFIKLRAKRKK